LNDFKLPPGGKIVLLMHRREIC